MSDYRDDFSTHPNYQMPYDAERVGFAAPLVLLGLLLAMIAGVFFFSGGTGDVDTINASVATAPIEAPAAAPVAQ